MKHIVVVLTEPTEGREAEYNDYYEKLHLDEVLATTLMTSAQRFKLSDQQGQACPLPYLALYEVEADDAKEVLTDLNATRAQRVQSEALNRRTAAVWVFSEIGPRHE
ncbi:unnamed protein product [Phaeothamnion confervicola]